MTTRRFRPEGPPRGRIGRLGLLGSSAIRYFRLSSASSVDAREIRIDDDGPAQYPVEAAGCYGALEASQPPAGVDTPAWNRASSLHVSFYRAEAHELRLRRLAAAARAGSLRRVGHASGDSSSSTATTTISGSASVSTSNSSSVSST